VAGCGGGGAPAAGAPAVGAPPSSAHVSAERAAVTNWLVKTNSMVTADDFTGLDQITTGQMRTIYQSEERQATLPGNADREPYGLSGLSITIPCQTGNPAIFVAYGDTNVFDLGGSMQSVAMVFERTGGLWKLAAAINQPAGSWPALCTQGAPPTAPAVLAPDSYTSDLSRVLTRAANGARQTTQMASPFAVNGFLAGPGSIPDTSATSIKQDRRAGISYTGGFTPVPDPTFALPLASGRGYWLVGFLVQHVSYRAPAGLRAQAWPDGTQVATPRPVVVHRETDTFITTYTAIDPPRSANAAVALDGFFGWPLTAVAS
jgi:hypothetical protein